MRRTLTALVAIALATGPALAALPPQYQRQAELLAIINDSAIVEAFGVTRPIEAVEWVEPDLYRVKGAGCSVEVRIVTTPNTQPAGFVGPRQFTIAAGELACP